MGKNKVGRKKKVYKILVVDDDQPILDTLSIVLERSGYDYTSMNNPLEAIELLKNEHFDLMILGYKMEPIYGDKVVREVRKFNKELYIILLTGHQDLVPPIETIKKLEIQSYCEKKNKLDQLILLIESGIKSVEQMNLIKEINDDLVKSRNKLEKAYLDTVEIFKNSVEARDPYTRGHSDRVAAFSVLLGKKLGLSKEKLKILDLGGSFHDIGKIGISDNILLKEGKLTNKEYAKIKEHPLIGVKILGNADIFKDIIPIVKYHHERYDGKGYPNGLKGNRIPRLARITAVVDTFDAMTSKRSYRNALGIKIARDEIEKCSGTQFDPKIAAAFIDILDNDLKSVTDIIAKYKH